jgi:hypothetical protein
LFNYAYFRSYTYAVSRDKKLPKETRRSLLGDKGGPTSHKYIDSLMYNKDIWWCLYKHSDASQGYTVIASKDGTTYEDETNIFVEEYEPFALIPVIGMDEPGYAIVTDASTRRIWIPIDGKLQAFNNVGSCTAVLYDKIGKCFMEVEHPQYAAYMGDYKEFWWSDEENNKRYIRCTNCTLTLQNNDTHFMSRVLGPFVVVDMEHFFVLFYGTYFVPLNREFIIVDIKPGEKGEYILVCHPTMPIVPKKVLNGADEDTLMTRAKLYTLYGEKSIARVLRELGVITGGADSTNALKELGKSSNPDIKNYVNNLQKITSRRLDDRIFRRSLTVPNDVESIKGGAGWFDYFFGSTDTKKPQPYNVEWIRFSQNRY